MRVDRGSAGRAALQPHQCHAYHHFFRKLTPIFSALVSLCVVGSSAAQSPESPAFRDLIFKGIDARRDHRYENSTQILEQALALAHKENSPRSESDALGFLALTYLATAAYKWALELRIESLEISRAHPDLRRDQESWALGAVARPYDLPKAVEYAREAVGSGLKYATEHDEVRMGRHRR